MAPFPATRNGNFGRMVTPAPKTRSNNNYSNNNCRANASPCPPGNASNYCSDHPVEVVGRIRDYPNRKEGQQSAFDVVEGSNGQEAVRIKTEGGYRDFGLDGISLAEKENLEGFYKRYVENRVYGIKTGGRCTVIMYGPTGSGKSHTMFGCAKEPGIVYRALHHILGDSQGDQANQDGLFRQRLKIRVTVLEIYNEDVFDLLATNVPAIGLFKNGGCRVKLEVMGKKVKNAMFISGNDAGKIAKEVAKVERRRVVKNTLCNERSSRSHCVITFDVPAVGGRLVLVDMAGSENIDQAGSVGFEAKMQTGKINQGNVALKRVVEAIANGDSHVPFRDSKLTLLLQDSFEDDGAKILMVLCASPDSRDIHKTVGTLEYGAKAKCIVRLPNSPPKEKDKPVGLESEMVSARIVAMDQYISKLQMDNKLKEQERAAAMKELQQKEEEIARLKAQISEMKEKNRKAKDDIEIKVEERARSLRAELERKCEEYERKANDSLEVGNLRVEKQFLQQQEEAEMLRRRLEEIESELEQLRSLHETSNREGGADNVGKEIKVISETCLMRVDKQVANISKVLEEVPSCDASMPSHDKLQRITNCHGFEGDNQLDSSYGMISNGEKMSCNSGKIENLDADNPVGEMIVSSDGDEENTGKSTRFLREGCLPTVFEEKEGMEEEMQGISDRRITLNVRNHSRSGYVDNGYSVQQFDEKPHKLQDLQRYYVTDARRTRIANIFLLCGNHREVAAQARIAGADKIKEVSKVLEPVSEETPKGAAKTRVMTPRGLPSSSSPVCSQKLTRSISLQSLPSGTLSPSTSPEDFACPKRLGFGNSLTDTNVDISTADGKVTKDHFKEMLQTTISINGLSSASALTEVKSPLTGCYEEFLRLPLKGCADCQNESTDNKQDQVQEHRDEMCGVFVRWETSIKEASGKLIGIIRIAKDASLQDLRKMIELDSNQDFVFLMLRDPRGAPVQRENEASVPVTSLPVVPGQQGSHIACLRLPSQPQVPLGSCYPGGPSNLIGNHLPISSAPATSPIQASNCRPLFSASPRSTSKMGDQPLTSAGTTAQKVASPSLVKGIGS